MGLHTIRPARGTQELSRIGPARRRRLIGHVTSILPHRPVVIEAPFGYGKSELLRAVAEELGESAIDAQLVEAGPAGSDRTALRAIREGGLRGPTHVICDNAEDYAGLFVQEAMLARAEGRDVRLLLATRPLGTLARAAIGAAVVLGPEEMVLHWEEVVEALRQSPGFRRGAISPNDAYAETLGWPFAVESLLKATARGGRHPGPGIVDFAGVFQDKDERDIFLALAFLPRFDRVVAAEVGRYLGLSGRLAEIRLGILPAIHDGGWITLHPMVAAALRREARSFLPLDPVDLQSAAAGWLADAGTAAEALLLALEVGDRQKIFSLLANHGQALVESGRIEPLITLGERFGPGDIPQEVPIAPVVWALMFGGATMHARGFLREAERDGDRVRVRTATLMTACMDGYAGHVVRFDAANADLQPTGDVYLDAIAVDLAVLGEIDAGMFCEARERHAAFRAATIGRDGLCPLTYGEVLVALAYLLEGRLEEARYHAAHAMGAAEAVHGLRAPAAGVAAAYLADILFHLGRWDEVAPLLAGRLDVVENVAFPDGAARALVAMARVCAANGRWDDAQAALDRLDLLVRRRTWTPILPFLLAEQGRLALIRGNDGAAKRLHERLSSLAGIPQHRNRTSPRFWDAGTMRDLSAVRLAWVTGDRNLAVATRDAMLTRDLDWTVTSALAAYTTEGDPCSEDALHRFEQLVFHRRPNNPGVLTKGGKGQIGALDHACRSLGLTTREQEILGLLCSGLSYKHIAGAAGLSLDTVKWHIKRIYAKLGVENRSSAVIKMATLAEAADHLSAI